MEKAGGYETAEFSMDGFFDNIEGHQTQAAFMGAVDQVVLDNALFSEEKVEAVLGILKAADSDEYQEFVNMQELISKIEFYCKHDDDFANAADSSEELGTLRDAFSPDSDDETGGGNVISLADAARKKKEKDKKRLPRLAYIIPPPEEDSDAA